MACVKRQTKSTSAYTYTISDKPEDKVHASSGIRDDWGGWWGEDGRTTIAIGIRRQNCSFGLFIVAVAVGAADVCLSRSFRAACASVTLPTWVSLMALYVYTNADFARQAKQIETTTFAIHILWKVFCKQNHAGANEMPDRSIGVAHTAHGNS